MSFPKYEVYKDSGVEWLGEVPEHWTIVPMKQLAVLNPKKSDYQGNQNQSCSFVPMEKLKTGVLILDEERAISDVYGGYTYFENGDILQAKVTPCFENKNIAVADKLTNGVGFGSSEINVLRASESVSNWFLYYRLQENNFMGFCTSSMIGVAGLKRIPSDTINNFAIALPKKSEQAQIAHFLDRETTRIDALIAEQQRLIELLKEKRQAVISHAVTKGIDRTVPMKDSGVEWLGEVPENWDICQSKHLFDSVTSGSRGWAEYYSDDGHLFFRITNLTRDTIDPKLDSKQFVNPPVGSEGERSKIRVCDILISITADLGSVCVANLDIADGYVSQHVALVRPTEKKVFSRWLAYFVLSSICKEQLLGAGYGGTKIQLSLEDIKSFLVATPPYKEQILIASFLDSEISKFESLINEAVLGIALLTERRSALISAAVTGKIDVRNWQPSPEPSTTHGR
jgi:type I restriction enzyme, S subunit